MAYTLDIRPFIVFKNCLPVTIHYSVGDVLEESNYVEPGQTAHFKGLQYGQTQLHLTIFGFRNTDWSTSQILLEKMNELSLWRFFENTEGNTSEIAKIDLGIHSSICHGTQVLSIYAPFWMINKTGKDLSYKGQDPSNVIYHPKELEELPMMFSYTAKSFLSKRKCSLRIESSSWSDPFTLDTIEDAGKVSCKKTSDGKKGPKTGYHVGVNINMSKSSLTKIISFTPYYMIFNQSDFAIEVKEIEHFNWLKIGPNECVPFWPQTLNVKDIIIRVSGSQETTSPFTLNTVHSTLLMLGNCYGGLHVECRVSSSETLLTVSPYKRGLAPVQLINNSPCMIEYSEVGSDSAQYLGPKESCYFTWLNPSGSRKLVWSISGFPDEYTNSLESDKEGVVELDKDRVCAWVSFLDGMQRVLLFSDDASLCYQLAHTTGEFERIDQEIDISINGIGISLVNNYKMHEVLYVSITSSDIVWEYRKSGKSRYKPLTRSQCERIERDFQFYMSQRALGEALGGNKTRIIGQDIQVNYLDERITSPVEGKLRRQFQKGLWCQIRSSAHQRQIHAKINRIQIDNQLRECLFPVIFAPVPPPKSVMADSIPKPFIELSVLEYKSPEHTTMRQYKYISALVQECHIKIDQGLINALTEIVESAEVLDEDITSFLNEDLHLAKKDLKDFATLTVATGQKDFYDYLHLSPLKVHLSFSLTSYSSSSNSSRSNFFSLFLQSLGVTIADTDDIIFRLAYFERKHNFYTKDNLISEMVRHYSSQAVKQIYVFIFGLDVIGNPYGLVVGVGRSVEDLFYEPFQGAVEGPSEFAEGLVIGVRSVFSGVVGGAAGTVSRITGALGKGLASLTFDEKFQNKRREAIKKRGRQNFGESLARGGKGLVMGIFDGVTGVATKPLEGAKEEGVGGFFKGVGKGVVGLVARPTGGIIDFASGTFDSVKRVTEVTEEIQRIRQARYLKPDGVVRNYDKKSSFGNKVLKDVDKGIYAKTDHYVTHEIIPADKSSLLLISDKHVLYIVHNQVLGTYGVEWEFMYPNITGPPSVGEENGQCYIIIKPKEDSKGRKVFGLFKSTETGKKVFLNSREIATRLARIIENLRINIKNED